MELLVKKLAYAGVGEKESFDISLKPEDLKDFLDVKEGQGVIKLTRVDEGILAEFEVELTVNLECDRCLSEFSYKSKLKFKRIYSLSPVVEENSDLLPVSKAFMINIIEPIREEALLSVPVKKLCREQCAGICSHCGVNLNTEKCRCGKSGK